MKITGYGPINSAGNARKAGKTGAAGNFAGILAASGADEAAHALPAGDVAATSALNNLLALQEISEEDINRRKLVQQGKNLLDVLEELRRRLLTGTLPVSVLVDLKRNIT